MRFSREIGLSWVAQNPHCTCYEQIVVIPIVVVDPVWGIGKFIGTEKDEEQIMIDLTQYKPYFINAFRACRC